MEDFVVEVLLWFWLCDRGVGDFFVVVGDLCAIEEVRLFCFLNSKVDADAVEKQDEDKRD